VSVYRMISAEKASTPVSVACALLGVSRSGYYEWATRAPSDRALSDAWLLEKIRAIWAENRKVYGAPRIHADLRMKYGVRVGRKRVERLMRGAGLSGLSARKRGRTTIRVPGVRVADDLVERRFRPVAPNVLWIADVTYLRTWEGWLYLAAVQDAYSRAIVGWSMAEHMRAELVVDALEMAVARRPARARVDPSFRSGAVVTAAAGMSARAPWRARQHLGRDHHGELRPARRHRRLPLAVLRPDPGKRARQRRLHHRQGLRRRPDSQPALLAVDGVRRRADSAHGPYLRHGVVQGAA